MKRAIPLLLILILCAAMSACGAAPAAPEITAVPAAAPETAQTPATPAPDAPAGAQTPARPPEEEGTVYRMRVAETLPDGRLVLTDETELFFVVSPGAAEKILLDGEPYDPGEPGAYQMLPGGRLDGLTVDVCCGGWKTEQQPIEFEGVASLRFYSIGTPECPGGTTFDLCGLYLQVLEDLWAEDEGLNGGAKYVSVDLSDAPGALCEGEKHAIAWIFAAAHGAEPLELDYEALAAQGYLTEIPETRGLYEWEDGLLFTIRDTSDPADVFSLPSIRFDAQKWRSPLGAFFFTDCSALWPALGTWDGYNVGAMAIS